MAGSSGAGSGTDQAGGSSPHLSGQEQDQAAAHGIVGPLVIHEIVREQGRKELERSFGGLAWSALAAGLSIGFSFVLQAYLRAGLPDAPWGRLVDSFGYSLGFLIVVLGQQQLFTETTLTALVPTLTEPSLRAALRTLRVWAIVLGANLVGTVVFGVCLARGGLVPAEAMQALATIGAATMAHPFGHTLVTAVLAGWLIGLMVWLLPAAGSARPLIIVALTYAVALCQFPHVIAGSVEAAFTVATGHAGIADYFTRFLAPTLIGNAIGGTALVALLNHAPVANELDGSNR